MGYETLIVGYHERDPARFRAERFGPVHPAGRCGTCRSNVYVNKSGAKTIRDRDCAIICTFCRHDPELGYHPSIIEAL